MAVEHVALPKKEFSLCIFFTKASLAKTSNAINDQKKTLAGALPNSCREKIFKSPGKNPCPCPVSVTLREFDMRLFYNWTPPQSPSKECLDIFRRTI